MTNSNKLRDFQKSGCTPEQLKIVIGILVYRCRKESNDTICWDCKNACGQCRWSRELKPVPGWLAIETRIAAQNKDEDIVKSYRILSCPEFERGR